MADEASNPPADTPPTQQPLPGTETAAALAGPVPYSPNRARGRRFALRRPVHPVLGLPLSLLCILLCFGIWWWVTTGETKEDRIVSPVTLPSISETFATAPMLWNDRDLLQNAIVTLRRVTLGFLLAVVVGVPLGVLAGCFGPVHAFLSPLILFGRNIPIAALVGVTFLFFGIEEKQKILFIFFAVVAFVVADTIVSIVEVGQEYVDTAYTLGANRWQAIIKVLVPLAMPAIFESLRILFGLAFGYIMLAEMVRFSDEFGGIGNLILTATRTGPRAHTYLILLLVPAIALAIDRILYLVQRSLFPHRYGGKGILNQVVYDSIFVWEKFKSLIFPRNHSFDVPSAPGQEQI